MLWLQVCPGLGSIAVRVDSLESGIGLGKAVPKLSFQSVGLKCCPINQLGGGSRVSKASGVKNQGQGDYPHPGVTHLGGICGNLKSGELSPALLLRTADKEI